MEQPTQSPVITDSQSFESPQPSTGPSRTSILVPIVVAVVGTALIAGGAAAYLQQRTNQALIEALENEVAVLQQQNQEPSDQPAGEASGTSEVMIEDNMANQSKLLKSVPLSQLQATPLTQNTKLYPEQIWLNQQQQNEYLRASRLQTIAVPPALGRMYRAVDWNSAEEIVLKDGSVMTADTGRKIALGFERSHDWGLRWGGIVLEYSTYDFSGGTEYYTYGSAEDYLAVQNGQKANVIVNGVKGIVTYKLDTSYDQNLIVKNVVFPFDSYYISGEYRFKKPLANSQTIIEGLYNGVYPLEEEADLLLFDNLMNSLVFMDKQ